MLIKQETGAKSFYKSFDCFFLINCNRFLGAYFPNTENPTLLEKFCLLGHLCIKYFIENKMEKCPCADSVWGRGQWIHKLIN